jgi:hypothetical protein
VPISSPVKISMTPLSRPLLDKECAEEHLAC